MKPVFVLDTDAGTNPDDVFALLMLLNSSEIELKLIITGNRFPVERAVFVKKILSLSGRNIPVFAGEDTGCVDFFAQKYIENEDMNIDKGYRTALKQLCDNYDEIVYIAIQGLSNIASFIKEFPLYKDKFIIYHMGVNLGGADEAYVKGGTNIEADPIANKFICESGLNLKIIGAHTTINDKIRVTPESKIYLALSKSNNLAHKLLVSHLQDFYERRKICPAMHDPLTVSAALGREFVSFKEEDICFDKEGKYRMGKGCKLMISEKDFDEQGFMDYLYDLVIRGNGNTY